MAVPTADGTRAKASRSPKAIWRSTNSFTERLTRRSPGLWLAVGGNRGRSGAAAAPTCVFVVDPIDGTVAFLKDRPHFTICAAVVHEGRPVAGVVYNPISGECLHRVAWRGREAERQADSCKRRREMLEGCRMLGPKATFEHPELRMSRREIRGRPCMWKRAIPSPIASRWWPCGSLRCRRGPVREARLGPCSGDLIVQEAGGRATTHTGAMSCITMARIRCSLRSLAAGPNLHPAAHRRAFRI